MFLRRYLKTVMDQLDNDLRARAVEAIQLKNDLQQKIEETRKHINSLEAQAKAALACGDMQTAQRLRDERQQYEQRQTDAQDDLDLIIPIVEDMKMALQQIQDRVEEQLSGWHYTPLGCRVRLSDAWIAPLPGWLLFLGILSALLFLFREAF